MAAEGYSVGSARVAVLPSLRGFQLKLRADLKTEFPNGLTIDVTPKFQSGPLKAQAAAAGRAAAQTIKFRAELDRKSLSDSLIGVAALSRAMRTLAVPGGLVAATPYVLSFASSLVQASGAAALLPAALTAGGVAAGTLVVGLSGVADTFKELAKADETAATTGAAAGKARKTALESVRSAQEALEDSQRTADRSAVQGAEQVADSRQAVADAISSAARQTKAAQDELTRSEQAARLSREALTRAYKDAREELQQLQFSVEGAGIAEEAAADRLDEARKQLDEARKRGAGAEEISDLSREVRQADLDLRMAADRYSDLKTEGMEWARTGISGSQGVVAAQRQADEANQAVHDSQAALTRAQAEGDRSVADARRDLGRTIVAVGQQQEDATRAVERASLALRQAQDAAAVAAVAGASTASLAMAKLSPAARDLVTQVRALGPAWTSMRLDVQDRLLAGIGTRVNTLGTNYIPVLNSALGLTADGYNRAATETLDWLNQASTTADVRSGLDNVALGINNSSSAMQPLLAAFKDFFVVGSEFLPGMGTSLTNNAVRFREFVAQARESGRIREWIQSGIDTITQLGRIVVNTGSIIRSALGAVNGSGRSTLDILEGITGRAAAALKTPEGAAGLREFFATVRTLVGLFFDKLVQLWPVIVAGGGAFAALLVAASPVTGLLFDLVVLILPPLLGLITSLAPVLGPAIALFGLWRASVAAVTLAMAAWRTAVAFATAVNVAYQLAMGTNLVLTNAQAAAQSRFTFVKLAGVVATKAIAAATWLFNAALRANPIGIVITILAALVAGLVWAYQNVGWFRDIVDAAWRVIASVSTWLWENVLKPAWDAFVWVLKNIVGPVVMWLWTTIIKPYFDLIGGLIKFVWEWIIKPAWDALVWVIRNVIGPAAMWLWNSVIKPAWDGIGNIIGGVWRNVIKPAWDAIVGGLNWVGDNFNRVVGWIGDIWNRLKSLLAKPINFMIGTVWNNGIRKAWNLVAGILPGINPVGELPLIKEMAEGGRITGGIPGKDSVPIMAMADEFVVRREIARPTRNFLEALNAGQPEALQAAGGRFARFAAGGPIEKGINFARAQHGKPYVWGGVGPRGFDCSGLMSAIANVLMGRPPHRRIGTTDSAPWPGWSRGLTSAFGVGFFKGNPGHMAGTLAGNNVEAGGSPSMTKFVQNAAGAKSGQFRGHMSLPQVGGEFVGGGDGGGFFNWVADKIRQWVREIVDPAIARLPHPPPAFAGIPRAAAVKVRDLALDWFLGQSASDTAAPGSGPVRQQVQAVAHRFGWGEGRQWAALDWLISKESGWNPRAQNPRSTAYGLFQFLNSTWATVGGYKTDNPGLQAEFGSRYIRNKYRDPIGAQAFHRAHNWYDFGGYLMPGAGTYFNGTGVPELVLPPGETRAYDTLSRLMRSGRLTVGSDDGQAGGIVTNHTWNVYEVHDAAETASKIQRRQELAARTGAPL